MLRKNNDLSCPKCHSSHVEMSRAHGLKAVVIRLFSVQAYRCLFCYKSFWVWQKNSPDRPWLFNWLMLFGLLVMIPLCYQWLFVPGVSKKDNQNDQAVTNAIRTIEPLESDGQRDLVSSLAFNQPDNDLEQEGFFEVSKLELEEKLAEAKTKVQSDNAQALLQEQRVATLADITEELRSLLKVDINYAIDTWRQAWQSGDSKTYLSFYSAQFEPVGDVSLASWQDKRRLRVMPSKQISLNFSDFDVVLDETNQRATVSFDQEYQSNSYSDKTRKQLTLVKENEWRIVSEVSL